MITFKSVEKKYQNTTLALNNITFEILKGEFTVVLGPSGSGKSTLLKTVNGLVIPCSGIIKVDNVIISNNNIPIVRKNVGMIFQQHNLVGNLSVLNNVLAGILASSNKFLSCFYIFSKKTRLKALEVIDRVGLLDKAYERTDILSGGEQQRVGIARALLQEPKVLLADEPVASLDPIISTNILKLLFDIAKEKNITVLCSLHQVDFALEFSERIIGLSRGEIVLNDKTKNISIELIKKIYTKKHNGLFFDASEISTSNNEYISWKTY